ncbi:Inactive histone-lysine N-methyltransferase 2E [Hyphodiscus hymeniophilus]|uniref:Inactive histone-lysine N-methyltransferase 2E n=1 Tax=Hyphodiscus hymeniophilus TaxID=353542 RepID=A0A9P6VJH8_9HELO|nr:Inactive histone-lysine N-methyltransferase 2E [Hyphodiscus hymeniophilus]
MTETPDPNSTQIATPLQTVFHSTPSISGNDAPSATEPVDENPDDYTIKCICDWSEDDGNTIYCETCNTWQHIECFYPGRAEETSHPDFAHSCADCKPRPLDRRRAIEWQQGQSRNKLPSDNGDKKMKRPASKSHKKKTKPADLQVNGFHDHDSNRNGSPQDQHPQTKKTKGHRSTQSVSSQVKRTPPFNSRANSHTHPPSPAHTPPDLPKDFLLHTFSDTFKHLYDDDRSFQRTDYNTYSLEVTNRLTSWLNEPGQLQQDTGLKNEQDAFSRIRADMQEPSFPELRVDKKDVMINDASLRFCSLIAEMPIKYNFAIGEFNGVVGFQKDYCNDLNNGWGAEYAHPKPFVFFPSYLPLYIDARNIGSDCRYARRSCRPNAAVDTMVRHGSDYHFWVVSERSISAGEQITLPWDFRFKAHVQKRFLHLLNLGEADGPAFDGADITEEEYEHLTNVTYSVLSDYGGCACELGADCAFARFHRNYHGRLHNQSNGVKSKKGSNGRKSKTHVSPTSTGHATNSRAASEGQQDQYDDDESRSVSGSVRSKPRSRDLTPLHGVSETNGILTEPSDREKRKLAALEDSFRKMEQGQPSRKKKRTSEGSTMSGQASATPQPVPKPRQRSVAPRSISNTNGSRSNKYVDASTSGRESDPPFAPFNAWSPTAPTRSPGDSVARSGSMPDKSRQTSIVPKHSYADASTQTDEVEGAWYSPSATQPPKRSFISLSRRLLKNRLKLQAQIDATRAAVDEGTLGSPTMSMDIDRHAQEEGSNPESPIDSRDRNLSIASSTPSIDVSVIGTDVNMPDAPAILVGNTIKPPPPPWPGQSDAARPNSLPGRTSPDLRVQMPPAPSFSSTNISGTGTLSGSVTPSSAAGSISQSPFGTAFPSIFPPPTVNGAVQSPAKGPKKLSLSDYRAARAKKAEVDLASKKPGSSPTIPASILKASLSAIEEAKTSVTLEGSVIVDTPMMEQTSDPIASNEGLPSSDPAPKPNMSSDQLPNGTL